MVDFAELDAIAEEYWHPGGQPGPAFGVVRDGEFVHWGGFGQRFVGGRHQTLTPCSASRR